jgi:1,4-alpha-glucan branching enzyme
MGGAGIYAKYLCRHLSILGEEVHVISAGLESAESIEDGVYVHRIPFPNKFFKNENLRFISYLLNLRKYYKAVEKDIGGFDLFHCGWEVSDFSLTKSFVKIPRVVTVHHLERTTIEAMYTSFWANNFHRSELYLLSYIQEKAISRADTIITVSNFVKKRILSDYNVPPSKIKVIHNGIDLEGFQDNNAYVDNNNSRKKDEPVILYVGRVWEKRKNLPLLLRAFRFVLSRTKARLIIVGSGNQESVRKLAKAQGIEDYITYMGFIDDCRLKEAYNMCDVLALPSFNEGFALVLLESIASGKPFVSTDVGIASELETEGFGYVAKNEGEFADKLLEMVKNPIKIYDAKDFLEKNFSWEKCAKETLQVYESIVKK